MALYGATDSGYYKYATWGGNWGTTTDAGTGWYYPNTDCPTITNPTIIIKEKEVTKEMAQERSLFKVYVVDPRKNGTVLLDGKLVIAENENQAMLKAGVATIAAEHGRELEQVDVHVEHIGTFIRPRKETQRVKIAKDEED